MSSSNIEDLVSLLSSGDISREELVNTISKIQFATASPKAELPQEIKHPSSNGESKGQAIHRNHSLTALDAMGELDTSSKNYLSAEEFLAPAESLKQFEKADESTLKLYSMTTQGCYSLPVHNETRPFDSFNESAPFLTRLAKYQNIKALKRKNLALELRKQQEKECSFQPQINRAQVSDIRLRSENWRRMEMEQQLLEKQERERAELAKCTFKPHVHSSDTQARYMKPSYSYKEINSNEFTFRPKIGDLSNKSERVQNYLNIDAYKRLFEGSRKAERKEAVRSRVKDAEKRIESFYSRQCEYEQRRQEKLVSSFNNDFKPTINEKSKEIARRLNSAGRQDRSPEKSTEYESTFTFQPEILAVSKERPGKSLEEMSVTPYVQREEKVKKLRKELMQKEAKEFTFHPLLNPSPFPVESKLQLHNNLATYLERVSKNEESKKNMRKLHKEIEEAQEVEECTYVPKINFYPHRTQCSVVAEPKSHAVKQNGYSKRADKI